MNMQHFPTMIEIDDKIVSLDIIDKCFVCDLEKCKGICCVEGESGAPLEDEEVEILERIQSLIAPYLRKEGIRAISDQGVAVKDPDDEMVTPLIDKRECAYAIFENGIAKCGIEKAWEAGVVSFRKPVSCHIYPIRTKFLRDMEAVNYDIWSVCEPARVNGKQLNVPVYVFVEEAINRKYGKEFFSKLKIIEKEFHGPGADLS